MSTRGSFAIVLVLAARLQQPVTSQALFRTTDLDRTVALASWRRVVGRVVVPQAPWRVDGSGAELPRAGQAVQVAATACSVGSSLNPADTPHGRKP